MGERGVGAEEERSGDRLPWRARALLASLSAGVSGVGVALALGLRSDEVWWYLAMGKVIDRFRAIPAANHLSYGAPTDAPSLFPEWLSSWGMALVERSAGVEGVVTLRNLLFTFGVFIISLMLPARMSALERVVVPGVGGILASVALYTMPMFWAVPLWGVVCAGAMYSVLHDGVSQRMRAGLAWLILPIVTLWANLDVAWGMVIVVAVWAAVEGWQRGLGRWVYGSWGVVGLLVPVAAAVNPRGVELVWHTLMILREYPGHPELALWAHVTPGEHPMVFGALLVGLASVAWWAWRGRERGVWSVVASVGAAVVCAAIALTHLRAALWAGLAMPLWCAGLWVWREGGDRWGVMVSGLKRWQVVVGVVGVVGLVGLVQPSLKVRQAIISPLASWMKVRERAPHAYVIAAHTPVEAGELLARANVPRRVWASWRYEPYVVWRQVDRVHERVVFGDKRVELISEERRELRRLVETTPDLWRGVFQNEGLNAALLHKGDDAFLVEELRKRAEWHVVEEDEHSVYFMR